LHPIIPSEEEKVDTAKPPDEQSAIAPVAGK